jgi:hypothetical protein
MALTREQQLQLIPAERERIRRIAGDEAAHKYEQSVIHNVDAEIRRLTPPEPTPETGEPKAVFGYQWGDG